MCERVSGASAHPTHHCGPSWLWTVHQRPHTCHNPMGGRLQPRPPLSSQAASPPVVQPRRPLGPVAVVATAKGQHCRHIPASSLSLTFVFRFHGKSSLFHFSSPPSLEGPLLPRGLGEGSMCSPVLTLCVSGPSKQTGLRGHSVPNMELGGACDTPGFEGVGRAECCGQLC